MAVLALLAALGATGVGGVGRLNAADARAASTVRHVSTAVNISVGRSAVGRPIRAGFLGLSLEYWAVEAYAGKDPAAINPALVQLIRDLAPGPTTVLRIGGDSTDKTWWPVPRMRRPPGVNYSLDQRRLEVIRALADAVGARLTMGINLEADSTAVAHAEAAAMLRVIGARHLAALELGNEPELYGNRNFGWYVRDGQNVTGRPATYDMAAFTKDFARIGARLPGTPLAGPSSGGMRWMGPLGGFTAAAPRVHVVTIHRYPLQACFNSPGSPTYPTIAGLLSPMASRGLAQSVVPDLAFAHSHHLAFRIDEMNTVSCGDPPGVPDTFAMALWVLDALFADAQVGVDGVNIHTYPSAVYELFKFRHLTSGWRAIVEPEYYGLLMFSQAAPPGARLISTRGGCYAVRVWATRDPHGAVRVVLINDDTARSHLVSLRVAGARGAATVERLHATSAHATRGVTLAGRSYDSGSGTGQLPGQPEATPLRATGSRYLVRLPAASAALVTLR